MRPSQLAKALGITTRAAALRIEDAERRAETAVRWFEAEARAKGRKITLDELG
jgi:hypothetical protein